MRPIPDQADADHSPKEGSRERRPEDKRLRQAPLARHLPRLRKEGLPVGVQGLYAKDCVKKHIAGPACSQNPNLASILAVRTPLR